MQKILVNTCEYVPIIKFYDYRICNKLTEILPLSTLQYPIYEDSLIMFCQRELLCNVLKALAFTNMRKAK